VDKQRGADFLVTASVLDLANCGLEDSPQALALRMRLADELAALKAERKQVRTRIEKLLEQIDQLSTT